MNMNNSILKFSKITTAIILACGVSVVNAQSGGVITNPFASASPSGNGQDVMTITGTTPNNQQPQINYTSNQSGNLNQNNNINLPMNPNDLVDPAQAQQMSGLPQTNPAGLPRGANRNGSQGAAYEQAEDMIEILNTPDERIMEINRDMYNKGRTINRAPYSPPKALNTIIVANLSPGSTAPVIRLAKNRSTAIIMTDAAGQPWPIMNYDGLSNVDFAVKRLDNPAPDGYVLSVTPRGQFVSGNLNLILKGLPSPVSLEFLSDQKEFDGKVEVRVKARGPNATPMMSLGLPPSMDTTLLSILEGVAPARAKPLNVSSNAAQAWLANDGKMMYLRTRYKVQSPAPQSISQSPDGTYAYKMNLVDVVLYNAGNGQFGEMTISGF